jgi:hypothetical protein
MPHHAELYAWTERPSRHWFHRCDVCQKRRFVASYYECYPKLNAGLGWWYACAHCLVKVLTAKLETEWWAGTAYGEIIRDYARDLQVADTAVDGLLIELASAKIVAELPEEAEEPEDPPVGDEHWTNAARPGLICIEDDDFRTWLELADVAR